MKCVIIDDEPLAIKVLEEYIDKTADLTLVKSFDDAISGASYLASQKPDLLFIDIDMPDLSGLEIVASLENRPLIIFTTAHKKYAIDGFELEAVDFLLKPIVYERFVKAVAKALFFKQPKQITDNEAIIVKSEYKKVKILLSEIEYIESMEDYIKIYISGATRPVLSLMSLKKILETLPSAQFSRIHRSYIVPHKKVVAIQNKKAILENGNELNIGDSHLDFIEKWRSF